MEKTVQAPGPQQHMTKQRGTIIKPVPMRAASSITVPIKL